MNVQLVLLGPPGSGKGTMADDLVHVYHIPHISTGDIFRQNIRDNTSLGREAAGYINTGALVPDSLTIALVADRLNQQDCKDGFLLDGFPRTCSQADALNELLSEHSQPLTAVLNLVVSDETVIKRLSGRRLCSGCGKGYNLYSMPPRVPGICDACGSPLVQRDDDKQEIVTQRLRTYYQQTLPLIAYYRAKGVLIDIDNEGEVGSKLDFVLGILDERLRRM
jgi:adenylate kinase